jgi:tripartite-type tricarboxylate transporter receptor subunit TctC
MTRLTRRAAFGVAAALALPSSLAQAQSSKPIEFVVPGAPGGGADILARQVAQSVSQQIGQQVIVVNKAGGGFVIGTDHVAKAPADGHTFLVGISASFSLQPLTRKALPYKITDFAPVAVLIDGPLTLTVNTSMGVNTFQEFVAKAKAGGKPLRYSTNGPGTLTHLYGMLLSETLGFPVVDVAYRGNAQSTADLVAGHIDFGLESPATTLGHVADGKLKFLAMTYDERAPLLPDVPTFKEMGHSVLSATYWIALLAPAGTPQPIIDKINAAANKALAEAAIKDRLLKEGLRPGSYGPEALAQRIVDDNKQWSELVKSRNIVLD